MSMVSIKGKDKAEVLLALYEYSRPLGLGFFQEIMAPKIDVERCREILKEQTYFDYMYGRVMKVDLSSDDEFDPWLYDRDNGPLAAQRAVNSIGNHGDEE